jgi:hypothetical protein
MKGLLMQRRLPLIVAIGSLIASALAHAAGCATAESDAPEGDATDASTARDGDASAIDRAEPAEIGDDAADVTGDVASQPASDAALETTADASSNDATDAFADALVDAGGVDAIADAGIDTGCAVSCGAQSACVVGVCMPSRRVFVSSKMYTANLGGHTGADSECQIMATSAGLGGVWMAWVSDNGSSPAARFTRAAVPYRLIDGTLIAANWTGLTSGSLAHAISNDEHGTLVLNWEVWTATTAGGTLAADGCNSFTSSTQAAKPAQVGLNDQIDSTWSNRYAQFCDRTNPRIYCIEQ